jgi:Ni2+-binding GTPase involved in maturation of urease and hydrogenase
MKIHLLSGFLGSGKTTAMEAAAGALVQQGIHTGVITNDQGIKLVAGFLKAGTYPAARLQVVAFAVIMQRLIAAFNRL